MLGLVGKRIVNTRAVQQAEIFSTLLRERGAVPVDYPCIAIVPPENPDALDAALVDLVEGHYDWLVLTSANTVFSIAQRLAVLGLKLDAALFKTAAIGPATAEAAYQELGIHIADLPREYIAESLAEQLSIGVGARVFLPASALAHPTLAQMLTARGAKVDVVTAYQTVRGNGGSNIPSLLAGGAIDMLTFTSASTVTYFLERLNHEGGNLATALAVKAACIGPKTAITAQDNGFTVLDVSSTHTLDGLIRTLETFFDQTIIER